MVATAEGSYWGDHLEHHLGVPSKVLDYAGCIDRLEGPVLEEDPVVDHCNHFGVDEERYDHLANHLLEGRCYAPADMEELVVDIRTEGFVEGIQQRVVQKEEAAEGESYIAVRLPW